MRLDEEEGKIRVTALNRQVVEVETSLASLRERERETGNKVISLHKQERELETTLASLRERERETGNRVVSLHKQERELEGTVGSLRAETARLEGPVERYCGCVHVPVHEHTIVGRALDKHTLHLLYSSSFLFPSFPPSLPPSLPQASFHHQFSPEGGASSQLSCGSAPATGERTECFQRERL